MSLDKNVYISKYLTYMFDRSKQLQEMLEGFYKMKRKADMNGRYTMDGQTITNSQWMTLNLIHRGESVSVKDIRLVFAISSSAATQLVGELIKKHCVVKGTNPIDNRTAVIRLTPRTKQMMARAQRTALAHMSRLFSKLTDEEFADYARLNQKIISSF